jgi:hypothetical protein
VLRRTAVVPTPMTDLTVGVPPFPCRSCAEPQLHLSPEPDPCPQDAHSGAPPPQQQQQQPPQQVQQVTMQVDQCVGGAEDTALLPSQQAALEGYARLPFDASELFALHQFYFSPPPNPQLAQERQYLESGGSRCRPPQPQPWDPARPPPLLQQQQPQQQQQQQQQQEAQAQAQQRQIQAAFGRVRQDSEDHLPPTKRPCNNVTQTRIAYYPRLKVSA